MIVIVKMRSEYLQWLHHCIMEENPISFLRPELNKPGIDWQTVADKADKMSGTSHVNFDPINGKIW